MNNNVQYNGFDEVNIGTFQVLSQGDLVIQSGDTVDTKRMCRSVDSQILLSSCEFSFFSPNLVNGISAFDPLLQAPNYSPNAMLFGICTITAPLNNYAGSTNDSYAYNQYDGYIWHNGAQLQFVGTSSWGDFIAMVVDPVNALLYVYKNGISLGAGIAITAGQAWYFAATVAGPPGDYAIYANNGLNPFRYPLRNLLGWWSARNSIAQLMFGTEPYMAQQTDNNPWEKYAGDIDTAVTPTQISNSVRFWMFGNSAPSELGQGGLVQMQINDPKGLYTDLTLDATKNAPCVISRVKSGAAMATAETLFTGIYDHCSVDTRQTKQIYARDQGARLLTAPRRALFDQSVDKSVAGKPRPLSIGICRNYQPDIYDTTNFFYALADEHISGIGRLRIAGKQLVLNSDYSMTTDTAGVDLAVGPQGVFTAETSDTGGAFNSGLVDYLGGIGTFTTVSGTLGGGTTGTSTTAGITVSTGSKTITVSSFAFRGFVVGSQIQLSDASLTRFLNGTVTSYNTGTGSLVMNITSVSGSGTLTTPITITGGVNQPSGWTSGGYYAGPFKESNCMQVIGTAPNQVVRFPQVAVGMYWFTPNTPVVLQTNKSYAYSFTTTQVPYAGVVQDGNGNQTGTTTPGTLVFGYYADERVQWTHFVSVSLDHVGTYSGVFFNNSGSAQNLVIGFLCNNVIQGTPNGNQWYLDISKVILQELPALADNITLTGPGLTNVLKNILVNHGPLDLSELATADTDLIDTQTGYLYGIHVASGDDPLVSDMAQQVLDSVCSAIYADELGKFRVARLFDPSLVSVGNLAGSLTATDIQGELVCYPDMAEKLTTRLKLCKNWYQYAATDFGQTSLSDCPLSVRNQLMLDYQYTAVSGVQLANRYQNARNIDPLKTLLDQKAHGQSEINYACGLYKVARDFYVGQFFEPTWRSFKLMQTWNVKYPIPGLTTGKQLVLLGFQKNPATELCTLIFWG